MTGQPLDPAALMDPQDVRDAHQSNGGSLCRECGEHVPCTSVQMADQVTSLAEALAAVEAKVARVKADVLPLLDMPERLALGRALAGEGAADQPQGDICPSCGWDRVAHDGQRLCIERDHR